MLNAGYEPLHVVNWQKAIILWLQDKVDVLEYHSVHVRSASHSFRLPSVVRLRQYISPYFKLHARFSRQNVFLRDQYTCQYCHLPFSEKKLTLDHVLPVSKGGQHNWENVVTACSSCNNKKADKTPTQAHMKLLKKPVKPRWLPAKEFALKRKSMPEAWLLYLEFQLNRQRS